MFLENLSIALKAIGANKMRSILTTLGVIIGVASVIAVVSLVQGMKIGVASELEDVGATYVTVFPDVGEERQQLAPKIPALTYEDGDAIVRQASEIREFTPIFFRPSAETKYRDERHVVPYLLGVSESYQDVVNHWVDRGRFFTPVDMETKSHVCTLGVEAARKLNIESDPIGKVITVNGQPFTVVGVMEKKGNSFGQDRDDLLIIPFPTAAALYGADAVRTLRLDFQAMSSDRIDLAKEQITDVLRTRHGIRKGKPDDFRIILQEQFLKTIGTIATYMTGIMAAVVGIALLVGGIGIMNIMLVSVTERTREIGIRKSVGARRQDVLLQFLIEAVTLSGVGGIVGVIFGFLLAVGVRQFLTKWIEFPPVHTPIWSIVLSFGFCTLLGVIFGIYPAAKASKLDPIEALRYE
jgi:ABC-type antimicrobial peptide transport system, permease component